MTPPQDEDSRDVTTRLYNHGGCGNAQPVIRKDGLKLWGSWKKGSKDPEVVSFSYGSDRRMSQPKRNSSLRPKY